MKIKMMSWYLLVMSSLFVQAIYADETETIYKYDNSNGVPEFTDTLKPGEKPDAQREVDVMTSEQEAASKAKLDQIVADDKELDVRMSEQKKRDAERSAQRQQEQNTKQDDQEQDVTDDEGYYYNHNRNVHNNPNRPIDRPINRPVQPIVRPTPR